MSRVPADLMLALPPHCHPGEVIFYSALFSFLLSKMGTGREPAVGGPAGLRKKQTGTTLRSAWHDHTRSTHLGFAGSAHGHCCI